MLVCEYFSVNDEVLRQYIVHGPSIHISSFITPHVTWTAFSVSPQEAKLLACRTDDISNVDGEC